MPAPYTLIGVESSPYSVKVRAVLRYRHLPHRWLCRMPQFTPELAHVRPLLMPIMRLPDGTNEVDSTPILLRLEDRHPNERSILPEDPVLDLFGRIIEDMADEWLTKSLFHYRFAYEEDRAFAPLWVMDDTHPGSDSRSLAAIAEDFLQRQSGRMSLVGATPENAPVLIAALDRVVAALGPFVALDRFLFGSRPSLADFGLFGQLKTVCTDPTPAALIRTRAPRLEHWVRRADDLSGVEGDWQDEAWPNDAVRALLNLAGDSYLPFLTENARAIENGSPEVALSVADGTYRQRSFSYQVKCLAALQEAYGSLDPSARERADPILRDSGCLDHLSD